MIIVRFSLSAGWRGESGTSGADQECRVFGDADGFCDLAISGDRFVGGHRPRRHRVLQGSPSGAVVDDWRNGSPRNRYVDI